MGIFDALKKNIFGVTFESKLMKSINSPVFIKDFIKECDEIIQLNGLINSVHDEEAKKKLNSELTLQKYVQEGLSKIYFELKNSSVPFYGLHNIRLEYNGSAANIDFLIITHQFFCIVKSKTLQGNIEIDSQGNFNRWIQKGEKWTKEGLYSPVEQNRKAELVLKGILSNLFSTPNMPVLSLTVFTNPKATLNFKDCPEDIQNKVIKVDLLNAKINELVENTVAPTYEEPTVLTIAETLKDMDSSEPIDYKSKFGNLLAADEAASTNIEEEAPVNKTVEIDKEKLFKILKAYRTATAASNNIPPYFIFNNEELDRLIEVLPRTKEHLLTVKGFGGVKVEKYGEEILKLINAAID